MKIIYQGKDLTSQEVVKLAKYDKLREVREKNTKILQTIILENPELFNGFEIGNLEQKSFIDILVINALGRAVITNKKDASITAGVDCSEINQEILELLVDSKIQTNYKQNPAHYISYIRILIDYLLLSKNFNKEKFSSILELHLKKNFIEDLENLDVESIKKKNDEDLTELLIEAIRSNNIEAVKILIEKNINVNLSNYWITPLKVAMGIGYSSIMKLLIINNADVQELAFPSSSWDCTKTMLEIFFSSRSKVCHESDKDLLSQHVKSRSNELKRLPGYLMANGCDINDRSRKYLVRLEKALKTKKHSQYSDNQQFLVNISRYYPTLYKSLETELLSSTQELPSSTQDNYRMYSRMRYSEDLDNIFLTSKTLAGILPVNLNTSKENNLDTMPQYIMNHILSYLIKKDIPSRLIEIRQNHVLIFDTSTRSKMLNDHREKVKNEKKLILEEQYESNILDNFSIPIDKIILNNLMQLDEQSFTRQKSELKQKYEKRVEQFTLKNQKKEEQNTVTQVDIDRNNKRKPNQIEVSQENNFSWQDQIKKRKENQSKDQDRLI